MPIVYILSLIVVILITFVTYLSCRKILKEPAVEALRIEIPNGKNTKSDFTTKEIQNVYRRMYKMSYSQMVDLLRIEHENEIVFVKAGAFYIAVQEDAVF